MWLIVEHYRFPKIKQKLFILYLNTIHTEINCIQIEENMLFTHYLNVAGKDTNLRSQIHSKSLIMCMHTRTGQFAYLSHSSSSWLKYINIVEAPLKNFELWCLCWKMMFRWTIKQPGIQKFWNLCNLYQDIYDWISPLNKRSGRPFILTQQSMGRKEYGISGHLHIFTFFFFINGAFELQFFSGLHFYTISKTLIACIVGTCSSDFVKWNRC